MTYHTFFKKCIFFLKLNIVLFTYNASFYTSLCCWISVLPDCFYFLFLFLPTLPFPNFHSFMLKKILIQVPVIQIFQNLIFTATDKI